MTAFERLRHEDRPLPPARAFAQMLRRRIETELDLIPAVELPERTPMTDATSPEPNAPDPNAAPAPTLVPYLVVHDAPAAIDWYRQVFDAREVLRYVDADGKVGHCELAISDAVLYLADEYPDYEALGPRSIGGSPVQLTLQVPDVDAVWARAIAAGADGRRPVTDEPYGDRGGSFVDPFGHRWRIQTRTRALSKDEIEAAMGGDFTIVEADD